jgi:two-component system CheB/CheR fusion protein
MRLSIDYFFRSLAQDRGANAICIVLSGAGSDGALGLRAVKGEAGLAMVQNPETAAYDSMPRSALATGLADAVLAPREMGPWLQAYGRHVFLPETAEEVRQALESGSEADSLFLLVRNSTGYDFSHYKEGTIGRRIERRMAVNRIDTLADYIRLVQKAPAELDRLWKDFLIRVTQFFRNPKAFAALEEKVIPALFADRPPNEAVRVWVPGCSTGEEAYTIAMLLQDHFDRLGRVHPIQVFATDIDDEALQIGRLGIYPASVAADVPVKYLRRYFLKHPLGFQMSKLLRGSLVFARHDVTHDPPFSRIDLVSCRNLLIYLRPPMQARVLDTLTYALKPDGVLLLGQSESLDKFAHLYKSLDKRTKLYRRVGSATPAGRPLPWKPRRRPLELNPPASFPVEPGESDLQRLTESLLLAEHTPASAVIDEKDQILFVHGHTGLFLEPAIGRASMHILKMVRDGLRTELSQAIREARATQQLKRFERLRLKTQAGERFVSIAARPLQGDFAAPGALLVLFEDLGPLPQPDKGATGASLSDESAAIRMAWLEKELADTRETLQTANEELETSNEELQSTVEELQSSNEELMTSQEELSSINEELHTVNVELEDKIRQLEATSDDMENLLVSTEIGTIFLDLDLRIRRFTPPVTKIISLIESDVGRPVGDIAHKLDYDGIIADAEGVLDSLEPKILDVRSRSGVCYSLRITLYRTGNNAVDGVVLTFVDMTERILAPQEALRSVHRGDLIW